MTQEDKELLLKDLCARLPYGVKVSVDDKHWCDFHKDIPVELTLDNSYRILLGVSLGYVKPYLFPLSSMTEEQSNELFTYFHNVELKEIKTSGDYLKAAHLGENAKRDWLNKNHFDYHYLIEKGLALDATGLNIYWL